MCRSALRSALCVCRLLVRLGMLIAYIIVKESLIKVGDC